VSETTDKKEGQVSDRRQSRRKRRSLRTRLVVAFVVQLVVVVAAVGYLTFTDSEDSVNDVAGQLRAELSERVRQKVDSYVEIPYRINNTNADAFARGILSFDKYREAAGFFWKQMKAYDTVAYISVGTKDGLFFGVKRMNDGKLQLRVRHPTETGGALSSWELDDSGKPLSEEPISSKPNYDPRVRPWYTRALAAGETVWTGIESYYSSPNELATGPVTPIIKNGETVGVISTDLQLSQLSRFMKDMKIGTNGVAVLIEASGILIAASKGDVTKGSANTTASPIPATQSDNDRIRGAVRFLEERFGRFESITETTHLSYEQDGKRHFLTAMPYRGNLNIDWLTVIAVPESDFLERILESRRVTLLLCAIALILSFIFSYAIARSITTPLMRLTGLARRLRSGDLDVEFETGSTDEIGTLSYTMNDMVQGLKDRDFIRDAFGRYLSPELARRFMHDPESLRLGGHIEQVTILMSDLRGFTSLSERIGPEQMVQLLNRYLGCMTEVIIAHRGTIIEFLGDAILVVFGAPLRNVDDPERAVRCAIAMQRAMLDFNAQSVADGIPALEMGIAVNTGKVVAGNIGSESHVKYGVVGEPVNLTARLESLNLGGQVLLSQGTYLLVADRVVTKEPKVVSLKGVTGRLRVYELEGIKGEANFVVPKPDPGPLVRTNLEAELFVIHGYEMGVQATRATVVRLGTRRIDLTCDLDLPALTKIKLRIKLEDNEWTGETYATVTDTIPTPIEGSSSPPFQVVFTAVSDRDREAISAHVNVLVFRDT
jgi:adenylate cyclase